MLENANSKLVWDFEFNLWKTTRSRRLDLILEDKEEQDLDLLYGMPTASKYSHQKTGEID